MIPGMGLNDASLSSELRLWMVSPERNNSPCLPARVVNDDVPARRLPANVAMGQAHPSKRPPAEETPDV
jgi:hypothetical protein